eukprot:m.222947 g.222947  ORF g.222947 m.222947 type:complete len:1185 (+) comp17260_c0_seq2:125-3679(+)
MPFDSVARQFAISHSTGHWNSGGLNQPGKARMSQNRQGDCKSPVLAIDPSPSTDTIKRPAATPTSAPVSPSSNPKTNRNLQTTMAPAPLASVPSSKSEKEQQRPSSNGKASSTGKEGGSPATSNGHAKGNGNGQSGVAAAAAVQSLSSKDLVRPLTVRMEPPIITDVSIEVANSHPFHSVASKLKYTYHHNRWCLTPDGLGFADCHSVLEPNGRLRATLPPQSPIFPAVKLLHPPCHVVAVDPRGSQWINVVVAASDNFFIQQMTVQVQYDTSAEFTQPETTPTVPPHLGFAISKLAPGTMYYFRAKIFFNDKLCHTSIATQFQTLVEKPSQPKMPEINGRKTTSLAIKWKFCAEGRTGGSPIDKWIMLWDQGKDLPLDSFIQAYEGPKTSFRAEKLKPSSMYRFKVRSHNVMGWSEDSDVLAVSTANERPSKPYPPALVSASVDSLTLRWDDCGVVDASYCIQSEGEFGWMPWFDGMGKTEHTQTKLARNTPYRIRMRVAYSQGVSEFSDVVEYSTVAAAPNPPPAPKHLGTASKTEIKLGWEVVDDGGATITGFTLERDQGQPAAVQTSSGKANAYEPRGAFTEVYTGLEQEHEVTDLQPGHLYHFRVRCANVGGNSEWSACSRATTAPNPPLPPTGLAIAQVTSTVARVEWGLSANNGGAKVGRYALEFQATPDAEFDEVHVGPDQMHRLEGLAPGQTYAVRVSCRNREGWSAKSDPLSFTTLPAAPEQIMDLSVVSNQPHDLVLRWSPGNDNGDAITEYSVHAVSVGGQGEEVAVTTKVPTVTFKKLAAAANYAVFVVAKNSTGASVPSSTLQVTTANDSPATMTAPTLLQCASNSVTFKVEPPRCNGADITAYRLIVDGKNEHDYPASEAHALVLGNLRPDRKYKVRVQAINAVGPGPLSTALGFSTAQLPPCPPHLELAAEPTHAITKLKWTSAAGVVETELQLATADGTFRPLFAGRAKAFKATKLTPLTAYRVRGRDRNDAGWSEYSPELSWSTTMAMRPAPTSLTCVPSSSTLTYALSESDPVELQLRSVSETLDLQLTLDDDTPRSFCATPQFTTFATQAFKQLNIVGLRPSQAVEVRVRFDNGIFTVPKPQTLLPKPEEKATPVSRKRRGQRATTPSPQVSSPGTGSEAASTVKGRRLRKQGSTKTIQIDQYQLVAAFLIFLIGLPVAAWLLA